MAFAAAAYEEKASRHALVIGNKSYLKAPLRNSINDANAMTAKLRKLGFEVRRYVDLDADGLAQAIADFYSSLPANDDGSTVALFYYAGHAVQLNHRNYLVPLGISFDSPDAFILTAYDMNVLFRRIPARDDLQNIVVLDSCRNNPFPALGERAGDGLAPVRAPPGTLIAYATEPGNVALDGRGKHGVYTKHLLKHLHRRIEIEEVLKRVRKGVSRETSNRQVPWEHSSLVREVFINPPRNREVPDLVTF